MITNKQVERLPQTPGVYILKSGDDKPLYVGKARKIKSRVASYLKLKDSDLALRTQKMLERVKKIECIETETELEALILEADLIKRLKPKYNVRWKDDKAYKYIRVTTSEIFPRVLTARKTKKDKARYFGPFPSSSTVNEVLKTVRRSFPYCNEKRKTGKPCFYVHLGLCPGPCANLISRTRYQKNIHQLISFLQGKKKKIISRLEREMRNHARSERFEKAAEIRDKIQKIKYVTQNFRTSSDYTGNPNLIKDLRKTELQELVELLNRQKVIPRNALKPKNFRIEAYDISNISGKLATGSMVVSIDGQSNPDLYRRFKIKTKKKKMDDLTALEEILDRRFSRLDKKTNKIEDASFSQMPDLILIDGGKAQLNTGLNSLKKFNLKIPTIALAKRLENIIIPGQKIARLKNRARALLLLKKIRDESHRFAKAYHLKLRKSSVTLNDL